MLEAVLIISTKRPTESTVESFNDWLSKLACLLQNTVAGGKVILVGIEIHFMYRLHTFCVLVVNTMLESGKKKTLSRSYLIQK